MWIARTLFSPNGRNRHHHPDPSDGRKRRKGCCHLLHFHEDNTRFLLLGAVMLAYMAAGAGLFQWLEAEGELRDRERYGEVLRSFMSKYNGTVDPEDVERLLWEYGNASASGILDKRPRWDYSGAFYFVGTVVSTIGFGMTTPKTVAGRVLVIFYGFLGCSGAILFFNLFLERIITFLAYVLRSLHELKLRRKGFIRPRPKQQDQNGSKTTGSSNNNDPLRRDSGQRRDSQTSWDYNLDEWKPSVYWVMLYLTLATIGIAVSASFLYREMEGWPYFDCLYFCFVAFSTIGFGDLVTSQASQYPGPHPALYRLANFALIVCGCCCIYSLFNVTSIVIKQFLNWIMRTLDVRCRPVKPPSSNVLRLRRNALTMNYVKKQNRSVALRSGRLGSGNKVADSSDVDSNYDSDSERRNSGEMICNAEMMRCNKVSLAVMQKQLYESAQRGQAILLPSRLAAAQEHRNSFTPGAVGPLAIVTKKFGDDDT